MDTLEALIDVPLIVDASCRILLPSQSSSKFRLLYPRTNNGNFAFMFNANLINMATGFTKVRTFDKQRHIFGHVSSDLRPMCLSNIYQTNLLAVRLFCRSMRQAQLKCDQEQSRFGSHEKGHITEATCALSNRSLLVVDVDWSSRYQVADC